ncbi:hypothetical protein JCM14450A_12740 [Geobacillus stearothermophilus]
MPGNTRLIGEASDAASAAKLPERKNVSMATLFVLMPPKFAPSRFCAIAMMEDPMNVFFKKR